MKSFAPLVYAAALTGQFIFPGAAPALDWNVSGAPFANWYAVACSANGSNLVASASQQDLIYTSADGGATWAPASAPSINWGPVACSADGTTMAAVGFTGNAYPIYVSTDSGATWNPANAPNLEWTALAASADGTKLVAVSTWDPSNNPGPICTSPDSGATWTLTSAPRVHWNCVACSADGLKVAAASSGGLIYTSTNAGADWMASSAPNADWYSVVSSADVVPSSLRPRGAAASFTFPPIPGPLGGPPARPPAIGAPLLVPADGTALLVVGFISSPTISYPIYISVDSGATWTLNNLPIYEWNSVAASADGKKWIAAALNDPNSSPGPIYVSQTAPAPRLTLWPAGSSFVLSWTIPAIDFTLQQNSDLATTNWTNVATPPVLNLSNLQNQVILSPTNPVGFYRLEH